MWAFAAFAKLGKSTLAIPKGAFYLLNPTLEGGGYPLLVSRSFLLKRNPFRGEITPLNTHEETSCLGRSP